MAFQGNPFRETVRTAYKDFTLKRLYPGRYKAACKAPVEPGHVVFLEIRDKYLSDNFKLIRAALEKREQKISVVCIREGMENQGSVMKNCLGAIPILARAQFIFVNESSYFLSSLPIRPETTVIQTWHACGAFKKFGYSVIGKGFGTTREDLEKYPVHNNFSFVTVSAPEVVWAYAEAFHMENHRERILPIGVSRTDMFFSSKYREKACGKAEWVLKRMAPQLFASHQNARPGNAQASDLNVVPGRKIILYAPTFRGSVGNAVSPDALNIPLLKEMLGKDYILLINHHPFVKAKARPKIPASCKDFAFDMTDSLSIEELLTVADICITDYSSLIFEYSLFERPLIFFAFDMKEYLDERGFYYPISEMMPGPVCSTTQEVAEVLKRKDADFDLARVREFKYRFMGSCDGHATGRILNLMDRIIENPQIAATADAGVKTKTGPVAGAGTAAGENATTSTGMTTGENATTSTGMSTGKNVTASSGATTGAAANSEGKGRARKSVAGRKTMDDESSIDMVDLNTTDLDIIDAGDGKTEHRRADRKDRENNSRTNSSDPDNN